MTIHRDPTDFEDAKRLIAELRREVAARPECVVVDPDFSPNLTRRMDCTEFPRYIELAHKQYDVIVTTSGNRYTFRGSGRFWVTH